MTAPEATPSTGPGSRRYARYENAGQSEIIPTGEREKSDLNDVDRTPQNDVEQQRQFDKDYNNLNMGLPLHRGSDKATVDAVSKGLHGNEPDDSPEEIERERDLSNTNHGTPHHAGFSDKDKARIKKALADDIEGDK